MKTLSILLILMLFLTACQQTANDEVVSHFSDYKNRLKNVLKIKKSDTLVVDIAVTLPKLARKRERVIVIPDNTLSLYDFVRLENCELKKLVAEKNNQLGKHMQATNGIIYQVSVRQAISTCIPRETEPQLKKLLTKAQEVKKISLVADFWQYSFGADWYSQFTSQSDMPIGWHDDNTLLASKQALQKLNQILLASLDTSKSQSNIQVKDYKKDLNKSIQTLENVGAYGKLIKSLWLSIQEINTINVMLKNAQRKSLCHKTTKGTLTSNKQLQYFNNVVAKYFAKDIQVYLSKLSQQGRGVLSEQDKLLSAFIEVNNRLKLELPLALQNMMIYHKHTEQLFDIFQETIKSHVQHIQKVQNICVVKTQNKTIVSNL